MEITNISSLDRTSFINQDYKPQDENLLNSLEINNEFGNPDDKIEMHIISPNGDIIESIYDFKNYRILNTTQNSSLFNQIELDPKSDLENLGYFSGQYDINYNFYRQLFLSNPNTNYFISEISQDRTEIKISNNNISYTDLGQSYLNYIATRNSRNFYSDFILNFGDNNTYIAVNVALDNVNTSIPSLYIKLYEPLPTNINLKDTLWLVESISEPYSFRINTDFIAEEIDTTIPLRGPNINIELNDKINLTTPYLNLSNLLNNSMTSSYQQLQSWLEEKSIEITIDYTNFNNFVHFSSAVDRLNNFKYKLSQIQSLQADINALDNLNPLTGPTYINTNKEILQTKLNSIIEKFDGYEYYLYFESGSKAWPKINSTKPYINIEVNDPQAITWLGNINESSTYYGGEILEAFNYDNQNKNYIWNNLPEYIKSDPQNSNLELFTSMLGQHYDYIWTYIKDITDINIADNRLDFGISKDLVADTLRNFGIKLYTNSRNQNDIYSSLLGINAEGNFLPSTGSYLIDTYVTSSQYTIPDNDIVKETYKRIYHNLPYLLKSRGTRAGLRALINCFGIPETILKIREYGGLDKDSNDAITFYEKFAYGFNTNASSSLSIPWLPLNSQYLDTSYNDIVPDTLEFRFKTSGIPTPSHYSQSLFYVTSPTEGLQFGIQLLYIPGTNTSYSTNELNETYSKYGELRFFLSGSQGYAKTSPLYLPFFNGDWWNIKLNRETGSLRLNQTGSDNTYTLSAKNSIYNGYNGVNIGFEGSTSLFISGSTSESYNRAWSNYTTFDISQYGYDSPLALYDFDFVIYDDNTVEPPYFGYLGGDGFHNSPLAPNNIFSGSFQEFRYWIGNLEEISFRDHTLHPRSIVGNNLSSSYSELCFRLPLGNELDNNLTEFLTSVHPTIAGSQITSSFLFESGSTSVVLSTAKINNLASASYETTVYTSLINTPNIGAITEIDEKIRIISSNLIPGDVLTPYVSIQKPLNPSYTNDLSIVDISLSPQDSINEDIIAQLGTFNIDEYIGDPRNASLTTYPKLDELRDFYFQKYSNSQNIFDLIKLLSYFDNSLFKMIKDFVPAKSNLSTGLTIKPHILERNKTSKFEPSFTFIDHSGSIDIGSISGSNGLDLNLNTDYNEIIKNSSLIFSYNHIDKKELFNGELGGTEIVVYYPNNKNIIYEKNKINISSSVNIINRYSELPFTPTLHNILEARKSNNYLDIDYSYNPVTPVNINYLSSSLALSLRTKAYPFLNSSIQDSNYTLKRHTQPRYEGSKLFSQKYNIYTKGDKSFGSDPVINLNPIKFAYFDKITSQSLTLNGRSNINIKYLIDSGSNIIELTEANKNLFDIQDIFNKTQVNIALDNINPTLNQKSLNGLKPIYAGGFRYEPILQNYSLPGSSHSSLIFNLDQEISFLNPNTGSQVTSSLPNSISIDGISLKNDISISPSLNAPSSTLTANLNSGINVKVTRKAAYFETIYQKISGNIKINVSVSPSGGDTMRLWRKNGRDSYEFNIPMPRTSSRELIQSNNQPVNLWDDIKYITIPSGYIFYGDTGRNTVSAVGPQNKSKISGYDDNNGIDYIYVNANNVKANLSLTQQLNSFGPSPSFNINPGGPYDIKNDNDLSVTATFYIEGFIELPPGVGNIGDTISLPLKSLDGSEGIIRTIFTFNKTTSSPNIKFTQVPTNKLEMTTVNTPYILTDAPNYIYTTQIMDKGFNSGSTSTGNWYFERGANSKGKLTQLTASYDLSKFYYDYISLLIEEPNYFTQILPTSSIEAGYQEITEAFNPKPGDLIKFYNHESNRYPYEIDFEREIINIIPPQGPIGNGSFGTGSYENRLVIEVLGNHIPNAACVNKNQLPGQIGKILNFIILSKIPDETNIIIDYGRNFGETSPGILYTEDINPTLKQNSGNIIKGLKSQNLI